MRGAIHIYVTPEVTKASGVRGPELDARRVGVQSPGGLAVPCPGLVRKPNVKSALLPVPSGLVMYFSSAGRTITPVRP